MFNKVLNIELSDTNMSKEFYLARMNEADRMADLAALFCDLATFQYYLDKRFIYKTMYVYELMQEVQRV